MARLIHLNGPPGIGKSTLARRYVAEHAGVLNCDIDLLRTMIGGWERDFETAGALIRTTALAMIGAYLRQNRDVVVPQFIARREELERFRSAALDAGAEYLHVMVLADKATSVARFYARPAIDAQHRTIHAIVEREGGAAYLETVYDRMTDIAAAVPGTVTITSADGAVTQTYRALSEALAAASRTDWSQWHEAYQRPGSGLIDRLAAVRAQIARHLDASAPRPVRVVSACAGDGRDLLGVLAERPDASRVSGLLVEYDPALAARARESAAASAADISVHRGDAASSDAYANAVPADLVLLCGIFGNVVDDDVRATVQAAPQLCAPGAEVIWTRHRREPDLTPAMRRWFDAAGFDEVAFISPGDDEWSVGVHRYRGSPQPLVRGEHWFTFVR